MPSPVQFRLCPKGKEMKIVFGTGHRPDKLRGGWGGWSLHYPELSVFCAEILKVEKPDIVISGMALGWDFAIAKAAISLGIPLHAYLPCENQGSKWPESSQRELKELVDKASKVVTVSKEFNRYCMQKRNEHMVKAGTVGLALWNGSKGGTKNCLKYADKVGKPIVNVWNEYEEVFLP